KREFDRIDDSEGMDIRIPPSATCNPESIPECPLAGMTEQWMAEVMSKCDYLREVLIRSDLPRDTSTNLRDLKYMPIPRLRCRNRPASAMIFEPVAVDELVECSLLWATLVGRRMNGEGFNIAVGTEVRRRGIQIRSGVSRSPCPAVAEAQRRRRRTR